MNWNSKSNKKFILLSLSKVDEISKIADKYNKFGQPLIFVFDSDYYFYENTVTKIRGLKIGNFFLTRLFYWIYNLILILRTIKKFNYNDEKIPLISQDPIYTSIYALIIKKILNLEYIQEFHGEINNKILDYYQPKGFTVFVVNLIYDTLLKKILSSAEKIRVVSQEIKNQIEVFENENELSTNYNSYVFPAKINGWNNYILDHNHFNSVKDNNFIFVGSPFKLKGLDVLIEAILLLKSEEVDIKLKVIGKIDENFEIILKQHNLKKNVQLLGECSNDEVLRLMGKSKFLLLASKTEGFGRVIIEAMMAKCVPIANRIGGIKSLVIDGENGYLINNNSLEEWTMKLRMACGMDNNTYEKVLLNQNIFLNSMKKILDFDQNLFNLIHD